MKKSFKSRLSAIIPFLPLLIFVGAVLWFFAQQKDPAPETPTTDPYTSGIVNGSKLWQPTLPALAPRPTNNQQVFMDLVSLQTLVRTYKDEQMLLEVAQHEENEELVAKHQKNMRDGQQLMLEIVGRLPKEAVPPEVKQFLMNLPHHHEVGDV